MVIKYIDESKEPGDAAGATPVSAPNSDRNSALSSIEDILADYAAGKMVILVDDENRENEGDLLQAADRVDAEAINFMARHGRGLICLTITEDRGRQLDLELMTKKNNERYSTNFTVSIEAAQGVTTGISAADRATTVKAAINPEAVPTDIVSPGHVFPIMAQPGGVLTRAGHTEAGVDLARMSGHSEASVICEVLNEDGTMARLPDLIDFGRRHGIRVGTIEDLIRYRLRHEPTVHRLEQHPITVDGVDADMRVLMYRDVADGGNHLAVVFGDINADEKMPVRVQVDEGVGDVLTELAGERAWSQSAVIDYMKRKGSGVLVVLDYNTGPDQLQHAIRERSLELDEPTSSNSGHLRVLGLGSQILADIGVKKMSVLGSPRITHGLAGFGLEIVEYVSGPKELPQPASKVAAS